MNFITKHRRWKLASAILSLSLLTVMAGAAVAPALDKIREHFSGTDTVLVQMIISMPSLFIALTSMFLFKRLTKYFNARTLVLTGLVLYMVFGCFAGLFSSIYLILFCRAMVGVGVGILMPLSTGLISFYFTRDKQSVLMGYSSAMNMMGGVVATLISGILANISWRLSFLVYLMGILSFAVCLFWIPKEKINDDKKLNKHKNSLKGYWPFIAAMFFTMLTFFIYPANFAMETVQNGQISPAAIPFVMALMDLAGFIGGLLFAPFNKRFGKVEAIFGLEGAYPPAVLLSVILIICIFTVKKPIVKDR
ncbi:MAG: MFS transporter [Lachnospiraceae bacterium]|jgi:MFS family permease|nr:MFS transporter [Lachnospiraceae bacterium]MEE3462246.1 MFS transporter [Lachnospiraceae bacterium]